VLEARAKFGPAVKQLTQALRLNPNEAAAARRLSLLIGRELVPLDVELDCTGLKVALRHETSACWLIAKFALNYLVPKGPLGSPLIMAKREWWSHAARALCLSRTANTLKDELFLEILRTNKLRDANLEYLLTGVRSALLLEVPSERFADPDLLKFSIA
jgi:hypothetical protein